MQEPSGQADRLVTCQQGLAVILQGGGEVMNTAVFFGFVTSLSVLCVMEAVELA